MRTAGREWAVRNAQCAADRHRKQRALLPSLLMAIAVAAPVVSAQTTRIASDFEIQQMERQAAATHDFAAQVSAHLNLGDARATRNETELATREYRTAAEAAERGRVDARNSFDLTRYATATVYAGLAAARLGSSETAFDRLEEAVRYASDDARIWNVYASTMRVIGQPRKAAGAARNAVAIAQREVESSPSTARRLELAIDQFTLAVALNDTGGRTEPRQLLETIIASLRTNDFDALRKDAARRESFEIYSTAQGQTPAYVSLLNKSQLLLAAIYEGSGDRSRAKQLYRDVLTSRTDDARALAALARLSDTDAERSQSYAAAFDANPFSIELIRDYQRWLAGHRVEPNDGPSSGAVVRRALEKMSLSENRAARSTLEELIAEFPSNDVAQYLAATNDIALGDLERARSRSIQIDELRRDIDMRLNAGSPTPPAFLSGSATTITPATPELRELLSILARQRITPEQRVVLDRITFASTVAFDEPGSTKPGQTVFESGSIDGLPFRFSEPTAFTGAFAANTPLRMTYRVLGATELRGADALLVEPLKLEAIR